jgi:hypothetical protein
MKKLVTLFTLAIAMVASADVASQNIVGYQTEPTDGGYRTFSVKFEKVGGGATLLNDVLDGNAVAQYSDLIQIYDPALGFVDYQWDGTTWFNAGTWDPIDIDVIPGAGFMMQSSGNWISAGQVASTSNWVHQVQTGSYMVIGNAFPVAQTLANFDWSEVATYADLVQMYDPAVGYVDNQWDGTTWFNAGTWDPISMTTPLADGFMFYSDTVATLNQRITPYYVE